MCSVGGVSAACRWSDAWERVIHGVEGAIELAHAYLKVKRAGDLRASR